MKYTSKIIAIVALIVVLFFVGPAICLAKPISSLDLINYAKNYDGQIVEYSGEVIGDVMTRDQYAWVNVNDGKNAIGIWVSKEAAKDIIYTGSYKSKGDWVEIKGVFNRSCDEHGGDFDIHARTFDKTADGINVSHPIGKKSIFLAGCLFFVLLIILLFRQPGRAKIVGGGDGAFV